MVEEAVRKVDGVRDAAAVGQPDDFWGERIVVFAEVDDGRRDDIAVECSVLLPPYCRPDRIVIVDKLPRNEMGKVRKGELVGRLSE